MEQDYRAKSPNPDKLQDLLDKLGQFDAGFTGWSDADIQGIAAPTLLTVGDCDAVRLDHMVRFLQLRPWSGAVLPGCAPARRPTMTRALP